jgi:hypothetical protein
LAFLAEAAIAAIFAGLQRLFTPLAPPPDFLVPFNHRFCLSPLFSDL